MITKQELIEQVKEANGGLISINVPYLGLDYARDFVEDFDITTDLDSYPNINKYINNVSYDEKRAMFNQLGFDVLHMTLNISKVVRFINNEQNGKSINQAFLDNERNVFVLSADTFHKTIYFVLEYAVDGDPLAEHTVDREAIEKEKERSEKMRNMMQKFRSKTKENDTDSPF